MCVPGRHVAAGEALKLGLLDRLTDGNTVDAAVRFAQSAEGKSERPPQRHVETLYIRDML